MARATSSHSKKLSLPELGCSHIQNISTLKTIEHIDLWISRHTIFQARWSSLHHVGLAPNSNFLENASMGFHEKLIVV